MLLIVMYLSAIVCSNLFVALVGPSATILTAFLFIGLNFALRDRLDAQWGKFAIRNLFVLSCVSATVASFLYANSTWIALGSTVAFVVSTIAGTVISSLTRNRKYRLVIVGSIMSLLDSLIFFIIAFGFPLSSIVIGQISAKIFGTLFWNFALNKLKLFSSEP